MTQQGLDLQQIPALGQQLWLIMAMVGNKPKSSPSVLIALFRNLSLAVDCPSACSGEKCYVILSANQYLVVFDKPLCVEDAKPYIKVFKNGLTLPRRSKILFSSFFESFDSSLWTPASVT